MKRVLLIFIFIIFNINIYANNANSDLIDISNSEFFFIKNINNINYIYLGNKENLVEILKRDIDKIYLNKTKNIYYILHQFRMRIVPDDDFCGTDVKAYAMYSYKRYNNFLLRLFKFTDNFEGYEGDFDCKEVTYPYINLKNMQKLDSELVIDDNKILFSLEEFIKGDYLAEEVLSLYNFKESSFNLETLKAILNEIPISTKTVTQYNDIAYYLQQANANDEAIFLLEKIIEKYSNRTVAYLNLADAYLGKNDKEKAKENYKKYIELMKQDNKEGKIPKRVLEFQEN